MENVPYFTFTTMIKKAAKKYENGNSEIPKIIHFIYLNRRDFLYFHYMAVATAAKNSGCEKILVWNDREPINNPYWDDVKKIPCVEIVRILPPSHCNGEPIKYAEHQADIIRLWISKLIGGVYLDQDILTLKSFFNDFDNDKINLVEESDDKLCNAIIGVKSKNPLIQKWIDAYETSFGKIKYWWNGLSVMKPKQLSLEYPGTFNVLKKELYFPFDYATREVCGNIDISYKYKDCYTMHFWEMEFKKTDMISETPEKFYRYPTLNTLFKDFKK